MTILDPAGDHQRNPARLSSRVDNRLKLHTAARMLAQRGAMTPEGVSSEDLEAARHLSRVSRGMVKHALRTLWAFRLLGWTVGDVDYLSYPEIVEVTDSGTRRPVDTLEILPDWFTVKHSNDELQAYRRGTVA